MSLSLVTQGKMCRRDENGRQSHAQQGLVASAKNYSSVLGAMSAAFWEGTWYDDKIF